MLGALAVLALLAAAAVLLLPRLTGWGQPLAVESIVLESRKVGPTCMLVGVLTTNGGDGTLAYRWMGDLSVEPIMTITVSGGEQIELGREWIPEDSPIADPTVALQVLEPQARRASAQPAAHCS